MQSKYMLTFVIVKKYWNSQCMIQVYIRYICLFPYIRIWSVYLLNVSNITRLNKIIAYTTVCVAFETKFAFFSKDRRSGERKRGLDDRKEINWFAFSKIPFLNRRFACAQISFRKKCQLYSNSFLCAYIAWLYTCI